MARDPRWQLARDAAGFQIKVLLDAIRDLALSPLSLLAALADLLFSGSRPPTYFYAVMRLGRRSEEWIDLWSAAKHAGAGARDENGLAPEEDSTLNADWVLNRVETLIRDPRSGKRDALVLQRWARMRLARGQAQARREPEC